MTIQSSVYNLTKEILNSESKPIVKTTINEIESFPELKIGKKIDSKIHRNQSARQAKLQFYGYLLANYKRKEIGKKFGREIPSLSEEHKEILINICKDMIYLNQKCINHLPGNLIHHPVLNLYTEFEDILSISKNYKPVYLNEQAIDEISLKFKKHDSLSLIGKIQAREYKELNKIEVDRLKYTMQDFENRIIRAGVNHYPKDFETLIEDFRKRSALTPIKYIFSLIGLKATLNNINQLIYQAFLKESLPLYNEDSIINYSKHSHFIGEGYVLKAIPGDLQGEVGELVHILLTNEEEVKPQLGRVEKFERSNSQDFGSVTDLSIRMLDKNMNQYHGLLKGVERKL
ncbi:hypothetical protein U0355_13020 [Salimicrobium sp. PL1-032A]|uniref:hypothetical protein n=1 Tax=Salimicrobium sp. PL1-032A TaxID=3095364 RepID=UPI0032604C89